MKYLFNNKVNRKIDKLENGGFTIIETLVAITVLMIAVSGPLVVASKGLNTALYARDQVIASGLAQESMELIKNMKNNNVSSDPTDWLNGIINPGGGNTCVAANRACDASVISDIFSNGSKFTLNKGFPIFYNKNSGYSTNETDAVKTIFYRYYYLTSGGGDCTSASSNCTVHVIVSWNEGAVPYDMELYSEIANILP